MRAKPGPSWAVYEMPGKLKVASGYAVCVDDCKREAWGYAMQYVRDGAVQTVVRDKGKIVSKFNFTMGKV